MVKQIGQFALIKDNNWKEGLTMKTTYQQLRERQQKEFNEFPCFYAFSNQQFKEGLNRLGCKTEELYRGPGGMFYNKKDADRLHSMLDRFATELEKAYEDDDFLYNAFIYELSNHEYFVFQDPTDTLDALGLDMDEILKDARKLRIWTQAEKDYMEMGWH